MENITKIIEISNKKRAPLKTAEILELGIEYSEILNMESKGILIRVKNGYYQPKDVDFDVEEIILGLFPEGILTMDTALYYHGYIKKRPKTWKIAISKNVSKSRFKLQYPNVKPSYMEMSILEVGLTHLESEHGSIRVYGIDRLICDILKYEEKLEHSIVQSAINHYVSDPNKDVSKLLEYSKLRKVQSKVRHLILPWIKVDELPKITEEIKSCEETGDKMEEKTKENDETIKVLSEKELIEAVYYLISEKRNNSSFNVVKSIYSTLSANVIDGKALWRGIKVKYIEDIEFQGKIREIVNTRQFKVSFDEKKVENVFWNFISPILVALDREEIFFGDWMPELERYL